MAQQYFPRGSTTLALFLLAFFMVSASPLQDLLTKYRSASPSLRAEAARVESIREQAKVSTAYPAPELGLEWGSRAVSPGMSDETMYYGGLLVGQEFMFPGKRDAMQKAENERTNMAKADYEATEKNGAFRLAQFYLEIHMAQARRVVLDSTLTVVNLIRESAQRRFETGMGTMEDLFRLKAELARLRSDSLNIMGDERAMRVMLSASLGSSAPVLVSDSIDFEDEAANLPGIDSLLILAAKRPETASMAYGKRMAAYELDAAALRKMPDFMLQGRYMSMMGPDEWSLMVGVKIPVAPWSSSEYRFAENAAKAREHEAQAREQAMAIMLGQEVKEAYARYQTAQARLKQVKEEQVVTAENALRSAQISYGNGKSDLTMSLDALRMALMAWDESVMAHMNVLQAILNLEKSAGMNPGTWLMETTVPQGVPQ
jgi:outer membrane protein TolC